MLKDEGEDCHRWIMDVLNNIEREKLLPPLLVVQILSQNDQTPLAVVKDYITRRLKEERELIEEDQKLINELRVETEQMRDDIHTLQTKAKAPPHASSLGAPCIADSCCWCCRCSPTRRARCASSDWTSLQCTSCVGTPSTRAA